VHTLFLFFFEHLKGNTWTEVISMAAYIIRTLAKITKQKGGNMGPFICLPVDLSGHKSRAVAVDGFVLRVDWRSTR
jgi:hypothetical protein